MKVLPVGELLSYLFPGIVGFVLIWFGIGQENIIATVPPQFLTNPSAAFLFPTIAFFIGVLSSSVMHIFEGKILYLFGGDPLDEIHLDRFKGTIQNAFNQLTGYHSKWSKDHFYVARALVREKAPTSSAEAYSQSFLRQFRRNSFPAIFLFFVLIDYRFFSELEWWTIPFVFILEMYFSFKYLYDGIIGNRKREVNEVTAGLVSLVDKLGEGRIISSKLDTFLFHGSAFSKVEFIELIKKHLTSPELKLTISGFPSVGKTTLSGELKNGKSLAHIEAESWFKDRKSRIGTDFSGAAYESYWGETAESDINAFLSKKPVSFKTYNHETGTLLGGPEQIYKNEGFILDGTIFSHHAFAEFPDLTLFLMPKNYDRWLELAIKRDITQRHYKEKESLAHNERKFQDILFLYLNQSKGCIPVLVDQSDEHNFCYIPTAGFFNNQKSK